MNTNIDDGSRISKITKRAHKLKSTLGNLGEQIYGKISHSPPPPAQGAGGYSSSSTPPPPPLPAGYQKPAPAPASASAAVPQAVSNPYVTQQQGYQPSSLVASVDSVPYTSQDSYLNQPFHATSSVPTATAVNPYQNQVSQQAAQPPSVPAKAPSSLPGSQVAASSSSSLGGTFAPTAPPCTSLVRPEDPTEADLQPGNFIVGDLPLAEGAQGALYRAFSLDNERDWVVKRMKFKTASEKDTAEIWAWNFKVNVTHNNIIKYLSVSSTGPTTLDIAMPIYSDGDLEKYIRAAPSALSQDVIISFCSQISSALKYLHGLSYKTGLVHRDLKPANVLLADNNTRCILIDFDSWGRAGKTEHEATYEFVAPETIEREESTAASDMWSLGAIMYCLLVLPSFPMLKHPVSGESLLLNHESWASQDFEEQIRKEAPSQYCPHLIHLSSRLLNHDVRLRPTAEQCCKKLERIRTGSEF
eukprot:TRINITY_DN1864_c2_g1_i1.p1 TRINITY_DN1864_c2_g1~~TRINITY_DN1864_c2_g1_i1.p1  ORF type:complete len:485 (+),score=60.03 TRINITY_DN1864_c2_g1_i1:42-1457(+)